MNGQPLLSFFLSGSICLVLLLSSSSSLANRITREMKTVIAWKSAKFIAPVAALPDAAARTFNFIAFACLQVVVSALLFTYSGCSSSSIFIRIWYFSIEQRRPPYHCSLLLMASGHVTLHLGHFNWTFGSWNWFLFLASVFCFPKLK